MAVRHRAKLVIRHFRNEHLYRISALEKVQRKNDNCCDQQQVNQATGDEATVKAHQPEQQQNYKNGPEHQSYLLISKPLESFVILDQASRPVCALNHIRAIFAM